MLQNKEFSFTIPMVEERDGNRIKVYDIFSLLNKERIVMIGTADHGLHRGDRGSSTPLSSKRKTKPSRSCSILTVQVAISLQA